MTTEHRGWNGQPPGRLRGSGGSPSRPDGLIRNDGSPITGNAAASARAYGWAARWKTSSLGPSSTMRPRVHDGGALADIRERRQVVSDEDHGEPELTLEPLEELEHLRLHHHVERGRRLVGDQEPRVAGERERDEHALPLAARELVRVVPGPAAQADRRARGARRPVRRESGLRAMGLDASAIWSPTRCTGLSECSAPWNTIDISVQRTARRRPGFIVRTSSSSSSTSPVISVPGGRTRRSAPAIDDLPQPDSPASPSVSPEPTSKETPRTAGTGPAWERYVTRRSRTERSGGLTFGAPGVAGRGSPRARFR